MGVNDLTVNTLRVFTVKVNTCGPHQRSQRITKEVRRMNALSWLAKQLAWEQRLTELRIERHTPTLAAAKRNAVTATAKAA